MGASSVDAFGNDDAADWAAELVTADDLSPIEAALDTVLDTGEDDLELPPASAAMAAAETLARLRGNFGVRDTFSQPVDEWVERVGLTPQPVLLSKAHRALDRILREPSELLALWQES